MEYTLRGLYDKLGITLAELSRRSGISDVTLASIRDGKSARRSTINTLLRTFSEIYGVDLSTDNVSGIVIKDKLARSAEIKSSIAEKAEKPPVLPSVVQAPSVVTDKPQKRTYKGRDTGLPAGCILAIDFARNHNRGDSEGRTFRDDMLVGLGPGKEKADYSERPKPSRPHEKERYLTSDQQKAALLFWDRHNVDYSQCNDFACWCHTVKNGQ